VSEYLYHNQKILLLDEHSAAPVEVNETTEVQRLDSSQAGLFPLWNHKILANDSGGMNNLPTPSILTSNICKLSLLLCGMLHNVHYSKVIFRSIKTLSLIMGDGKLERKNVENWNVS
jgi:hypothetical protein